MLGIVLAVVLEKDGLLLLVHKLEGLAHEPGTLCIFDVRSNLTQNLGGGERVQDVVLDLEILSQSHGNGVGLGVKVGIRGVSAVRQGEGAAEVERIVARLVPALCNGGMLNQGLNMWKPWALVT